MEFWEIPIAYKFYLYKHMSGGFVIDINTSDRFMALSISWE